MVPKGFESNLPKEAQTVIQEIQKKTTKGLLVASPSMMSAVQKEGQRKEDGVICDLLLLSESLGRLHLISLVSSGSQDQFFPHARATAKAVKKSLVRNGGCYEKFYITCQVVLCNRVGTEPLDISSPDSRYPKEYRLRSLPQELVKINKILQSLAIVLAQFPSSLSNKQGVSFLNLLTKEQFQLLYELIDVDGNRELWIQGVAGTGKTVVALEFIRRLLGRDPNLKPENILYVCERRAMLPQIRYVSFKFQGEGLDHVASYTSRPLAEMEGNTMTTVILLINMRSELTWKFISSRFLKQFGNFLYSCYYGPRCL